MFCPLVVVTTSEPTAVKSLGRLKTTTFVSGTSSPSSRTVSVLLSRMRLSQGDSAARSRGVYSPS